MSTTIKCPECGAAIQDDSKFCKYCGGKLPDDTKHIEVKIDKRIEDVAEVKRAEYEEKESAVRARKMKFDLGMRRFKFWFITLWFGIGAILGLPGLIFNPHGRATTASIIGMIMLGIGVLVAAIWGFNKM